MCQRRRLLFPCHADSRRVLPVLGRDPCLLADGMGLVQIGTVVEPSDPTLILSQEVLARAVTSRKKRSTLSSVNCLRKPSRMRFRASVRERLIALG